MSAQPDWEIVWSTDCTALYRDKTGVYPPELMVAEEIDPDEEDIETTAACVYRFPLERCWTVIDDDGTWYITSQDPIKAWLSDPLRSYEPWFAKSLGSVADSIGSTLTEIVDAICSDDVSKLAWVYESIGGYHGFDNFDGYPQEWVASEFAAWPERGVKLSTRERDEFVAGYVACALWCGVESYEHDESCPCREPSENGDAYDAATCDCEPELNSSGDEHDESELTDDARKTLTNDAHEFYAANVADLRATTRSMENCGHDFWLTRNRHGAGFWDRKHISPEADAALDRLTEASHSYGDMTLVQGHDMKVSVL